MAALRPNWSCVENLRAWESTRTTEIKEEDSIRRMIEICIERWKKENKRIVFALDEFQKITDYPELIDDLIRWYKSGGISILFIARQKYQSSYFDKFRETPKLTKV